MEDADYFEGSAAEWGSEADGAAVSAGGSGARGDRSLRRVPEQPLGIDSEHSPASGASSWRILEYSPGGTRSDPRMGPGASPRPSGSTARAPGRGEKRRV